MSDTTDTDDELTRLRDALGAAGHGWRAAQAATDRAVAEHRRDVDRLNETLRSMGVAREQLRQRMTAENQKLRESRDGWRQLSERCQAGFMEASGETLDDWVTQLRSGNNVTFGHAEAAGLAYAIERLQTHEREATDAR